MRVLAAACCVAWAAVSCASFDAGDGADGEVGGGDGGTEGTAQTSDAAVDAVDAAGGANVIATGESNVSSIAIDATHVYWTTSGISGHVAKCPRTGCAGAADVIASNQGNAKHVVVAGERIAWLADDTVRSVPKAGGGTPFSTTSGITASAFVVFGTTAYVASADVMRPCFDAWTKVCDETVGAAAVASNTVTGAVRFESDILVWTDVGVLRRVLVPSILSSLEYSDPAGVLVAAFESEIFYVTKDGFLRAIPSAGLPDGGAPRQVAGGIPTAVAMAVDVTDVYVVAESSGQVFRIAKNGVGGITQIATGLKAPRAIAIDTNDVYVAIAGTGEILRYSK